MNQHRHPRAAAPVTSADAWALAVSAHSGNGQPRGKSDLELVEAIHIAAERAIIAAGRGILRESAAGHALLNAIYDLTEAREDYDLAQQWGAFAGAVPTEDL